MKDGSPHPRGQWEGCGDGAGVNVREGGPRGTLLREVGWGRGWVPAPVFMGVGLRGKNGGSAGMTGGG